MQFEIYCDESNPDVFWSRSRQKAKYLLIGSLWIPAEKRADIKNSIKEIRRNHRYELEVKWHKVHKKYEAFYRALIDFFVASDDLRFRCIAVEGEKVDMVRFHQDDSELGFYKFYYQMLQHWILDDFNEYRIFCDEKTSRVRDRLGELRRVLNNSNISSRILDVQALPSHEVAIIQLSDFLLGMVSSRMNETISKGSFKDLLIKYFEERLNIPQLAPTQKAEQKFNIFKIQLQGGQ